MRSEHGIDVRDGLCGSGDAGQIALLAELREPRERVPAEAQRPSLLVQPGSDALGLGSVHRRGEGGVRRGDLGSELGGARANGLVRALDRVPPRHGDGGVAAPRRGGVRGGGSGFRQCRARGHRARPREGLAGAAHHRVKRQRFGDPEEGAQRLQFTQGFGSRLSAAQMTVDPFPKRGFVAARDAEYREPGLRAAGRRVRRLKSLFQREEFEAPQQAADAGGLGGDFSAPVFIQPRAPLPAFPQARQRVPQPGLVVTAPRRQVQGTAAVRFQSPPDGVQHGASGAESGGIGEGGRGDCRHRTRAVECGSGGQGHGGLSQRPQRRAALRGGGTRQNGDGKTRGDQSGGQHPGGAFAEGSEVENSHQAGTLRPNQYRPRTYSGNRVLGPSRGWAQGPIMSDLRMKKEGVCPTAGLMSKVRRFRFRTRARILGRAVPGSARIPEPKGNDVRNRAPRISQKRLALAETVPAGRGAERRRRPPASFLHPP